VVEYLKQYPGLSERIIQSIEAGGGALSFDDSTHIATLRALIAEAKAPGYARLITEELKSGTIDKLVVMGTTAGAPDRHRAPEPARHPGRDDRRRDERAPARAHGALVPG
jgi:hypothetical protein